MKVQDVLSATTPPLKLDDTVEEALGQLMEYRVRHLPVVEDDTLVGILSEEQMMDAPGPDATLRTLVRPNPVSARPEQHIFDAAQVMVKHDLSTLPVAGPDEAYVGLIRRHDIFDSFAQMLATQEAGAILALEVAPRDYALAKLVHLIEQNDAKVLAVASEPAEEGSKKKRVTLKLNVNDAARVRHVLEHNGYRIVASFGEEDDEMSERVQAFMRYLEV
jgi:acetoin utilization protein AcuB